jgi:sulfotransferase
MVALVPVAGLPRSGSTLLCNLLAQNPAFHATPTSGVPGLLDAVRVHWSNNQAFRAQGVEVVRPRIRSAVCGLLEGFYPELGDGKIVFDKSREWPNLLPMLEDALGEPVRILFPIRDVREVLASFEKLHRADPLYKRAEVANTVEARAEGWLHPQQGAVGRAIEAYRELIRLGLGDRLIILAYRHLTLHPQPMLDGVHDALGLPRFAYDIDHVEQTTHENDEVHGILGLHDIQPKVAFREPSWPHVLPAPYAQSLAQRYGDLISLAAA